MKVKIFKQPHIAFSFKWELRKLISYLYSFALIPYLFVGLHSLFCKKKKYKYEVSLCLIFKDEAPYLKEWLEYHLLIGVEHFYLYNNNSSDNYLDVLQPYINEGTVTLKKWEKNYAQVEAYQHCYDNYKNESHWIGFIDTDEFLNLSNEGGGNDIRVFLKKYRHYPSLHIFWRLFGTSGILKKDSSKLVIEQFTQCWPNLVIVGKSIINNDWNFNIIWLHWHKASFLKLPVFSILDNYIFSPYGIVHPHLRYKEKLIINHYWSKSLEEAIYKTYHRTDAFAKRSENIRIKNGFDYIELNCSSKDFSIQRWLPFLKERLNILK